MSTLATLFKILISLKILSENSVGHGSLHKSSIGSNREIKPSSQHHFYQWKIRENGPPKFKFHFVTLEETTKAVALLSDKKACQASRIPVEIIKENRDLMAYFRLHNFDNALSKSKYPASLKYEDIIYTNL